MRPICICLLFVFSLLQYQLWAGERGSILAWYHLHNKYRNQLKANTALEERNQGLVQSVMNLRSGKASIIEHHARYDLGMIRNNEIFYQIVS